MASSDRSSFIEPLPNHPSLEMQQKRAKELTRAVWAGDADAVARVATLHPKPPAPADLSLSDAQLVVARGYGFESWAAMKRKIESLSGTAVERFMAALRRGDVDVVRTLLDQHAEVRAAVNAPINHFDGRPIAAAKKNLPMLDLLLSYGADLNLKSAWWAGGFGVLEYDCTPAEAAPLIERGAVVDVFAAAHLGLFDRLEALVAADPGLVGARGGDGKTPLHCASTLDIAQYLVLHGASLDARDVDHESTAAQYLVREAPEVTRWLVEQGAWADIFMAVALNDDGLVERLLREDPAALDHRTGQGLYAVAHNGQRAATPAEIGNRRGDIYRWVFDHHVSAIEVAVLLGHTQVAALLMGAATPAQQLLAACSRGDRATAAAVVASHPDLVARLAAEQLRCLPDRARAGDSGAVRLMIELGFDPRAIGPDEGDALHWAAFLGNVEMTAVLLQRDAAAIGIRDRAFNATPLGWCIHGAVHGWACRRGDFAGTARLLLAAGETFDLAVLPTGCDPLDVVLRAHAANR